MEEKDRVVTGFDRVRLLLGGMMFSGLISSIIWPKINNTATQWVIMVYIGFVLMATFWDDV